MLLIPALSLDERSSADDSKLTLRPYQREALNAIIAGFKQFKRQLRVCPTGGGKTIEFAALAGHYQPEKTLIIAHRDELIEQARDKVYRFTGLCARVDGFSFAGFLRSDGKPVKDLNDFALIDPDQWEAQRDAIEEAFAFSTWKQAA